MTIEALRDEVALFFDKMIKEKSDIEKKMEER